MGLAGKRNRPEAKAVEVKAKNRRNRKHEDHKIANSHLVGKGQSNG